MAKKKSAKPVRIETLTDLVNVATPQNYELLMKDLALCIAFFMKAKSAGMVGGPCAMEWVDDGNNELTGFRVDFKKR
jgi:hypothetical protein